MGLCDFSSVKIDEDDLEKMYKSSLSLLFALFTSVDKMETILEAINKIKKRENAHS